MSCLRTSYAYYRERSKSWWLWPLITFTSEFQYWHTLWITIARRRDYLLPTSIQHPKLYVELEVSHNKRRLGPHPFAIPMSPSHMMMTHGVPCKRKLSYEQIACLSFFGCQAWNVVQDKKEASLMRSKVNLSKAKSNMYIDCITKHCYVSVGLCTCLLQ